MTQTPHAADGVPGACPDLDTLADLHAGVLDATTESALRQHVATCSDCTVAMAALDATVSSLGSMPQVVLPPDVAARIDAALTVEARRVGLSDDTTAALAAYGPGSPSSDRRLGAAPSDDRRLGTAPSGASPRPAAPEVAPSAGDGSVTSLSKHRERRRLGRGRMLLAAAAAAVVIGGGAVLLGQAGNETANQADREGPAGETSAVEERPEIQAFAAPKDVLEEGAIENDEVSEQVAGKMAEKAARSQCLNQIVPRPASAPEAVQQGTHNGKEAYAFVFATDDPDVVEMIIVDAQDCGEVLDTVTGPRA